MVLPRRSRTRKAPDASASICRSRPLPRHRERGTVFEIDPRRRAGLLEGLDEIALTLRREHEIQAFQASDRAERPWIHFARKSA